MQGISQLSSKCVCATASCSQLLSHAATACCRLPGQWVLEERSRGRPRFVGQPEGGLRDTGGGYFLLMKVRVLGG